MVTKTASYLLTIVPRNLLTERQLTQAARGRAEVLLKQAFHVIVRNFSNKPVHLLKHMVIAYTEKPPSAVHE